MATPDPRDVLHLVVVVLVASVAIHVAASILLGRSRFGQAFGVAVIGALVGFVILYLFGGLLVLAIVLAAFSWVSICGAIYQVKWFRSLLLGVVGYVVWVATLFVVRLLARAVAG